jgi:hypothetical protein
MHIKIIHKFNQILIKYFMDQLFRNLLCYFIKNLIE